MDYLPPTDNAHRLWTVEADCGRCGGAKVVRSRRGFRQCPVCGGTGTVAALSSDPHGATLLNRADDAIRSPLLAFLAPLEP